MRRRKRQPFKEYTGPTIQKLNFIAEQHKKGRLLKIYSKEVKNLVVQQQGSTFENPLPISSSSRESSLSNPPITPAITRSRTRLSSEAKMDFSGLGIDKGLCKSRVIVGEAIEKHLKTNFHIEKPTEVKFDFVSEKDAHSFLLVNKRSQPCFSIQIYNNHLLAVLNLLSTRLPENLNQENRGYQDRIDFLNSQAVMGAAQKERNSFLIVLQIQKRLMVLQQINQETKLALKCFKTISSDIKRLKKLKKKLGRKNSQYLNTQPSPQFQIKK